MKKDKKVIKRKYRYRNVRELLKSLKDSINFLSYSFKIPGRNSDDLAQEMRTWIISLYKTNPKYYKCRKKGWWYIRCKWLLMNMRRDTLKTDPLSKSISLDRLGTDERVNS